MIVIMIVNTKPNKSNSPETCRNFPGHIKLAQKLELHEAKIALVYGSYLKLV